MFHMFNIKTVAYADVTNVNKAEVLFQFQPQNATELVRSSF